jgi:hypothetical protein
MRWAATALVFVLTGAGGGALLASEHSGQVTTGGVPVPGATITATQDTSRSVTTTDQGGGYRFADLADGRWTIRVEMRGFATLIHDVTVGPDAPPPVWDLAVLPFEEIAQNAAGQGLPAADASERAILAAQPRELLPRRSNETGRQPRTGAIAAGASANTTTEPAAASVLPPAPGDQLAGDLGVGTADGFVINGSVNNSAASPFAQLRAFGNNRPGQRSQYNGGLAVLADTSRWDARPFTFAGQRPSKPSYSDIHIAGTFGGPVKLPGVHKQGPTIFVGAQRTADTNAATQSALMPTDLERWGDFSQSRDASGRPLVIVDPATGHPFPGNVIPRGRISPQAAALLGYYPAANVDAGGRYNYETPLVNATRQSVVQARVTQPINTRNQIFGTFAYQHTRADTESLFRFEDENRVSGFDTAINWYHRFSQFQTLRLRYQVTRLTNQTTPYFSGRTNVSGAAGIEGNDQNPLNWGPPALTFASGLAGFSDALYGFTQTRTQGFSVESIQTGRGRHTLTFGGGLRRHHIDVLAQQDPRGSFSFTGASSGSDLADFLLGLPATSSIAFGNADKYFGNWSSDAYLSDDWRVSPSLTVNAGVRWEHEAPITERYDRLVNLDVAPAFAAVAPVLAHSAVGSLTGRALPRSLVRPDWAGVQPRIGVSWRPVAGSSLVVRGGYGIYRNTSVYPSIATQLAQQPPLSTTMSVENSPSHPLTLAHGFIPIPGSTSNTFAIDPDFRLGYAHNWQMSVQRDLPHSLTLVTTYFGTQGRHLMQESLPNTYPAGAVNPCPTCPSGFAYLTSDGQSSRHSGQWQLRRRLSNGLMASVQYTLAKAVDDAAAFSGASLSGASIAQNWLDLAAERGRSIFDQRHQLTAQFEYTTGIGMRGGTLIDGWRGSLWKGWTITGQVTAGGGLPLTPVYLSPVRGTGVTGTIRADLTGGPTNPPPGYYLNPASYAPPVSGRWGTAGRNSVTGPAQFQVNAGLGRTFPWANRFSLDWRVDAINVLNQVTYAAVNTLVGSPQFGLPTRANPMRKLQTSLRVRF